MTNGPSPLPLSEQPTAPLPLTKEEREALVAQATRRVTRTGAEGDQLYYIGLNILRYEATVASLEAENGTLREGNEVMVASLAVARTANAQATDLIAQLRADCEALEFSAAREGYLRGLDSTRRDDGFGRVYLAHGAKGRRS